MTAFDGSEGVAGSSYKKYWEGVMSWNFIDENVYDMVTQLHACYR